MRAPTDSSPTPTEGANDAQGSASGADERRSPLATALASPTTHLTFLNADLPREAQLALWRHQIDSGPDGEAVLASDAALGDPITLERFVQEDGTVSIQATPAVELELDALFDAFAELDRVETLSASTAAWVGCLHWALTALSKAQIQPGLTSRGIDTWRIGPLSDQDQAHLAALAAALPDEAWASRDAVDGGDGDPLLTARAAVDAFVTSVADRFTRTKAAPTAAGHRAFASGGAVVIDAQAATTSFDTSGDSRGPLIVLRVTPPPPERPDDPFLASLAYQSRRDPHRVIDLQSIWRSPAAARARFQSAEASLLVTLRRAARQWAPVRRLLEQERPDRMLLTEEEVDELFGEKTVALGAAGLSVLISSELLRSVELTPVVRSSAGPAATGANPFGGGRFDRDDDPEHWSGPRANALNTTFDLSSLLQLDWRGEIDGQALTEEELAELAESKRPLIRFRGEWIRVDDRKLRRMRERRTIGASTALAAALGATIDLEGDGGAVITVEGPLAELGERIRSLDPTQELAAPPELQGELRPYQERGLAWLTLMAELGLGGVLADDMGLGKTIQLIATHLHRQTDRPAPSLVVCPASVVGGWEREVNRFAPHLKVHRYVGQSRRLRSLQPGDIVLTTYGVARRDADVLATHEWGLVIADEAQAIKNPASRTAKALRRIPSGARFALTGTPIQNQLIDLWAILDWSTPGLLGPQERFRRDIAAPVERDRNPEAIEQLNRMLRPFVLRRTKADPTIVPDLPPKTETDEIVPLTVEQAALYRATVTEVMAEIAAAEGIERKGLVLRLMTRLKQICNHPEHLLAEGGELAGRSGKLTATTELLQTITAEGDAALLFTQYVRMGELLQPYLEGLGLRTLFLQGSTSINERSRMVEEFQAGDIDVFLLSLRAGGTGLNLTAATHVIHYDRWWNPAVEDQASDRAWRIGQERPVQIHRMITEGTVEDKIAVLLEEKRSLASAIVGSGEGWISDLSDTELAELVALSDDANEAVDTGNDLETELLG